MKLKKLTRMIIVGDTYLNWFLGFILTVFPEMAQSFFSPSTLFPLYLWKAIGFGFILFAGFQTYHLITKITKLYYLVAMWLAIIPVLGLTICLLIFNSELYLFPKIIAWIGNIYMVWISWLYYNMGKEK